MAKILKMAGAALMAMVLLAAGYEAGNSSASMGPVERLEASGMVIDGGPIRAAAKWRM